MTLERPTAMESSSAANTGRELTKLITARHEAAKSTNQGGQRAKSALWARNNED